MKIAIVATVAIILIVGIDLAVLDIGNNSQTANSNQSFHQNNSDSISIDNIVQNITVDRSDSGRTEYVYKIYGILKNSHDKEGYITQGEFYDSNNKLVGTDTDDIDASDRLDSKNGKPISICSYESRSLVNMSKVVIKVIDSNGNVVYTTEYNFNMNLINNDN